MDKAVTAVDKAVTTVDKIVTAVDKVVTAVDKTVTAVDKAITAVDKAVFRPCCNNSLDLVKLLVAGFHLTVFLAEEEETLQGFCWGRRGRTEPENKIKLFI